MPPLIYSDPNVLTRIKRMQYRNQLPPLALLILSFLIGFVFASYNMRYPSLALSLIALVWYLYVGNSYRIRQKIALPETDEVYSPLTGKVHSLKRSSDLYQLKIAKSFLDVVEIRCPHESALWDGDALRFTYQGTPLVFRFEAKHLNRFEEREMKPGNVIGMISGTAICILNLPQSLVTKLKPGDLCESGVTSII